MFKAKTFRFAGQNKSFTAQNGKEKGRKSRVTKKPYSNFSLSVQFSNFTLASYHINDSTNTVRKKIKIACFHYKDGKLKHCVYHGI